MSKETATIGERLLRRRQALNLSIQDVSQEIQAPRKFIQALEEDRFEVFSAKVYALGFLKKLITLLNLEDGPALIQEFNTEWEIQILRKNNVALSLQKRKRDFFNLTPRRLALGGGGIVLFLFLSFFGYRLFNFLVVPKLELTEPQNQAVLTEPIVRVQGKTEKESRLTVNGRELKIDEAGNFDEKIELGAGLNGLEFLVQNRFGKQNKVTRYVLVK